VSILTESSWFLGRDNMVVTLPRDTPTGYLHSVLSVTVSGCGAPGESDRSRGFTMTTAGYVARDNPRLLRGARTVENACFDLTARRPNRNWSSRRMQLVSGRS